MTTYWPTHSVSDTNKPGPATLLSLLFCPSIFWSLLRPRSPLTVNPWPPLKLEKLLSREEDTPGMKRAKLSNPWFSCMPGAVCSVVPANVLVTCACVDSINGASAVTSTVVLVSPTCNLIAFKPVSRPATTPTLFCTAVRKPDAEISTLYSPAGIELKRNKPELSLVVLNVAPVAKFVAFICAPDSTAPWG